MNLNDMVKGVTGREGEDFVPYGNYCGIGGEGHPVDPIDEYVKKIKVFFVYCSSLFNFIYFLLDY